MISNILIKFISYIEYENTQGVRLESRMMITDYLKRIVKKAEGEQIDDVSIIQRISDYTVRWFNEADWIQRGGYVGLLTELYKRNENPLKTQIGEQLIQFLNSAPYEAFEQIQISVRRNLAKTFPPEFSNTLNREPRIQDLMKNKTQ